MSCVGLLDGQVEATVVVCNALELASSLHYLSSRPVCVCVSVCVCERERESARARERERERESVCVCVCMYTYIYACVWGDVNVVVCVFLSPSLSLCIIYI
jgi:hypothetical protein